MHTRLQNEAILFFLLSLFFALHLECEAQTIRVLSKSSGEALPGVTIQNKEGKGSTTDSEGRADISFGGTGDVLTFRKNGYTTLEMLYESLIVDSLVLLEEYQFRAKEAVVSSGRWEETARDVPFQVMRATAKEIEFSSVPTPADVLINTGEVFVQKSQLGGGSPMIRGFAANSLLMVVDGVRMNNAIFRSGNLHNIIAFDASSLESMDVLYGPGAALFGSDALGGVINLTTKKPIFAENDDILYQVNIAGRAGSAAKERALGADVSLGWKNFALFTSFSHLNFDDLRVGSRRSGDFPDDGKRFWYVRRAGGADGIVPNADPNVMRFSGYSQYNFLQKVAWRASSRLTIEYAFHLSNSSDIPRFDRLIEERNALPRSAEWFYGPQYWQMNSLTFALGKNKFGDSTRIILSQQRVEESRHTRRFRDTNLRSQVEKVDIWAVNIDTKKKYERSELYYGIEFFTNSVASTASSRNINTGEISPDQTRYPDGDNALLSGAIYLQYLQHLSDKFMMTGAVRGVLYGLSSEVDDSERFAFIEEPMKLNTSAVTFSAGSIWTPADNTRFSLNIATGFRNPNLDDIAKVFDSAPGEVIVPNPELEAERTLGIEAGIRQQLFDKSVSIDVIGYYTWLTNAIERRPFLLNGQDSIIFDGVMSRVTANQNISEGWIAGITATAEVRITEQLSLRSTLTYTAGRDITNDLPLRHVPPLFGRTTLQFTNDGLRAELTAEYNGSMAFEDLAPDEQAKTHIYRPDGSPAWRAYHLRTSYRLTPTWEMQIAVENIFDVYYRPFSSGIGAPGRNIIFTLRARLFS